MRRLIPAALALAALTAAPVAPAVEITLSGVNFDLVYDNASFLFETGAVEDPAIPGVFNPIFDQLGGFRLTGDNTFSYRLPPAGTEPGINPTDPFEIIPGDGFTLGGTGSFDTRNIDNAVDFRIVPKNGVRFEGLGATTNGSFDNPTEDASILFDESLSAAGASDTTGLSLGIFTSGLLPSGLDLTFAATAAPIEATYTVGLTAVSSSFEVSAAQIGEVDFVLTPVPEPASAALVVAGLIAIGRRRRTAARR